MDQIEWQVLLPEAGVEVAFFGHYAFEAWCEWANCGVFIGVRRG